MVKYITRETRFFEEILIIFLKKGADVEPNYTTLLSFSHFLIGLENLNPSKTPLV